MAGTTVSGLPMWLLGILTVWWLGSQGEYPARIYMQAVTSDVVTSQACPDFKRKTINTHLSMEDCQNHIIKRAHEIGYMGLDIFRKYTGPRNSGHSLLLQATH